MYLPSSSAFVTNKAPSGVRKHHKSTKPGTHKMGKMFSDGLAQYCVNLSRWFWSLTRRLQPLIQKLWLPVWDAIFFLCTHTCSCKFQHYFSYITGTEQLNKETLDKVMREAKILQPDWGKIANQLGFKQGQTTASVFLEGWHTYAQNSQPSWKRGEGIAWTHNMW